MKKIIITAITAAALFIGISASANQNALSQLVSGGATTLGTGACGIPDADTDANAFCSCFLAASLAQCNVKDPHKSDCTEKNVHSGFCYTASRMGVANFCKTYVALMPAGVTVDECTADLTYYEQHCGC